MTEDDEERVEFIAATALSSGTLRASLNSPANRSKSI